ncbi:MAG: hypothetical protein ABI452_04785, partial [Candidatus Limnocylindrales bacterium]
MSLRTRRSLAFPALLVLLVVACGGTGTPTTQPTGQATATPGGSSVPTPTTGPGTPSASGTPGEVTATPAMSGDAPADKQIFRIYCCSTDVRSLRPQAASGSDEISI